jgi:regulatory protein
MYLINKKTGVPEPLVDKDHAAADQPESPGDAPQITRSSDRRKQAARKREDKPQPSAKAYAVALLARQDYSASTLRARLVRKGYGEAEIEAAMDFVIGHDFQNDGRFAELRSRGIENRAGNLRIEMTLRQKGIAPELAKAQVRELAPEEERVVHAAGKFKSQVQKDGMTLELKTKIYRFLAYRGFSAKAIRVAIESLGEDGSWVEDM